MKAASAVQPSCPVSATRKAQPNVLLQKLANYKCTNVTSGNEVA